MRIIEFTANTWHEKEEVMNMVGRSEERPWSRTKEWPQTS